MGGQAARAELRGLTARSPDADREAPSAGSARSTLPWGVTDSCPKGCPDLSNRVALCVLLLRCGGRRAVLYGVFLKALKFLIGGHKPQTWTRLCWS